MIRPSPFDLSVGRGLVKIAMIGASPATPICPWCR
jgi:hypothetical protein